MDEAQNQAAPVTSSSVSDAPRLQFLDIQIRYVTSHFQIADAKGAGIVTYLTVLCGYTASRVSAAGGVGPNFASWLAVASLGLATVAIVLAFLAVIPRAWVGVNPQDAFSWLGRAALASSEPYHKSIVQLTHEEMQRSLADTVESAALILRHKYRLVATSIVLALASTVGQGIFWLLK